MDAGEMIYFSVTVRKGPKVLSKVIEKCYSSDLVSDVVAKHGAMDTDADSPVVREQCGPDSTGPNTTEVPLDTPLSVVKGFGHRHIEILLAVKEPDRPPVRSVFDVMKEMSAAKNHLPPKKLVAY
jgi:hypothetical protein